VLPTNDQKPATDLPVDIRRVLLGTDLSRTSELATDRAFDLARRYGAELLVVSVIDPGDLPQEAGRIGSRWDEVRDRRHAAAQELVARGRAMGLTVSFLVWTGDPGESIVSAAEAESVDLVVVGTHGRGTIGRLLLGSVSDHVVRHAPCPVLVVRPAAGRSHRPEAA
jgi:nucleotide-binding universal stress UspA family protein